MLSLYSLQQSLVLKLVTRPGCIFSRCGLQGTVEAFNHSITLGWYAVVFNVPSIAQTSFIKCDSSTAPGTPNSGTTFPPVTEQCGWPSGLVLGKTRGNFVRKSRNTTTCLFPALVLGRSFEMACSQGLDATVDDSPDQNCWRLHIGDRRHNEIAVHAWPPPVTHQSSVESLSREMSWHVTAVTSLFDSASALVMSLSWIFP